MSVQEAIQKKLGFGCMRLPLLDPEDQKSIDLDQLKQMVDAFMEAGCTYFDTAYVYHEGESEVALRKALVERYPRESFTLATKCLAWAMPDAESAKSCLQTSLDRLGTDYVDFYLLHNVGGKRTQVFDEFGLWEWVAQQKAEGRIRHWGFSMHDGADALDALLADHPEAEFVQLQINYLDWEDPVVESRRCLEVARKHGKPVIVMEPARGGRLADLPERVASVLTEARPDLSQASWAYRFCYNLPGVVAVLSGMSSIEQMEENVREFQNAVLFDEREEAAFGRAVEALKAVPMVPCTNCGYCVKGCPKEIAIPQIMSLLNLEMMIDDEEGFVKGLYTWQAKPGRASDCIECGECEAMCPQSIDVIGRLKTAKEHFED